MSNLSVYKEWLMRSSGAENPSPEQVDEFKEMVRHHRLRATILELLLAVWMDARAEYVGAKAYLKFQGMNNPSREDLAYFHTRILHAAICRTAVLVIVAVGWFAFAWWMGMWWSVSNAVILSAILVCGLSVVSGTRLIGRRRRRHS